MTRGRRPDPAEVRAAKGNTRKQAKAKAAPKADAATEVVADSDAVGRMPGYMTLRKRKLDSIGQRVRDKQEAIQAFMQPRLASIKFLKATDLNGFFRFCRYMAEWLVSLEVIDEEGFYYETSSPHTENMRRVHPAVLMRRDNERNLRMLEGEFGLTPYRRQQLMLQMANAGLGIPSAAAAVDGQPGDDELPMRAPSPIGFLGAGSAKPH